jgi:hypothetical protein
MRVAAQLFLVLSCLVLTSVASAQAYRWVDKDGKVRYSDVPPQGQKATTIKPPSGGPAPAAAAKDKEAPKPPAAKSAREAQDVAEKEKQEAAVKENCALSREQLTLMESGQRVMKLDAKGERYFIDDAQRAQEVAKAKENVSQWCK